MVNDGIMSKSFPIRKRCMTRLSPIVFLNSFTKNIAQDKQITIKHETVFENDTTSKNNGKQNPLID